MPNCCSGCRHYFAEPGPCFKCEGGDEFTPLIAKEDLTALRTANADLTERLAEAGATIEQQVFNLAGCSVIADSRTPIRVEDEYALPALKSVNKMAQDLAAALEREKKAVEQFKRVLRNIKYLQAQIRCEYCGAWSDNPETFRHKEGCLSPAALAVQGEKKEKP